jgi:putative addiction module killer protein
MRGMATGFKVVEHPEFKAFMGRLKDPVARAAIVGRIKRAEAGNLGDWASCGGDVNELRIDVGAGWRIYFTQRGRVIVVLLTGGSKKTQGADIRRARKLSADLD